MLTRRAVLKCGLVAAGATLLSSKAIRSYADVRLQSLQLTPFATELTFPPDLTLVGNLNPPLNLTKPADFRGNFLKDMHQHDVLRIQCCMYHLFPRYCMRTTSSKRYSIYSTRPCHRRASGATAVSFLARPSGFTR